MADLRKINIPEAIQIKTLVNENGKQERKTSDYTFFDYVAFLINNQATFNKGGPPTRAGDRILIKLDEARESEEEEKSITIDEPDWTILKDTSEEPPQGYPFGPTRLLLSFLNAINDAEKA